MFKKNSKLKLSTKLWWFLLIVGLAQGLLPGDWCKAVDDSDEYLEPRVCGLLGVSTQVAVPRPCTDIMRIDMVQGCVTARTPASPPTKCELSLSAKE